MSGSEGRQRAQVDKLMALPYMKPTDDLILLFSLYMEPVFAQIQLKNKQNLN